MMFIIYNKSARKFVYTNPAYISYELIIYTPFKL